MWSIVRFELHHVHKYGNGLHRLYWKGPAQEQNVVSNVSEMILSFLNR